MFGLTFEKLLLIAIVALVIVGPAKLPVYAAKLAAFVKQIRNFTNEAKARVREEMGSDFDEIEWKKLDPRQYDPRRIIRDALLEEPAPDPSKSPDRTGSGDAGEQISTTTTPTRETNEK